MANKFRISAILIVVFLTVFFTNSFLNLKKSYSQMERAYSHTMSRLVDAQDDLKQADEKTQSILDSISENIFLASENGLKNSAISITRYNPSSKQVLESSSIKVKSLYKTKTNSFGASDAIQYLPSTNTIYYATGSYGEMYDTCNGGDSESCYYSIYQISPDRKKTTLVWRDKQEISQWLVSDVNQALFLNLKGKTIKVDLATKLITTLNNFDAQNLTLSSDEKQLIQTSLEKGDYRRYKLFLNQHNLTSGDNTKIFIDETDDAMIDSANFNSDLSLLAFYSYDLTDNKYKLFIFHTKEQYTNEVYPEKTIKNYSLSWSGKSLLNYQDQDGMMSYDVIHKKHSLQKLSGIVHFLSNSLSGRYTTYFDNSNKNSVNIFDGFTNLDSKLFNFSPVDASELNIQGISWYRQ